MKVGLIGFGKTGRSVASVILDHPDVCLEWVVRRSTRLEHRSVPEFLGIDSAEPGLIYSSAEFSAGELLDRHPVDAIIDFSSQNGVDYYADEAASRGVSIVCAVSRFEEEMSRRFERWAQTTRVLWSPNITIGINFMLLAAQTLRAIAPCADVEIVEEHFKKKPEVSGTALRLAEGLEQDPASIKVIRAGASSALTRSSSASRSRRCGYGTRASQGRRSAMAPSSPPNTFGAGPTGSTGWRISSCRISRGQTPGFSARCRSVWPERSAAQT